MAASETVRLRLHFDYPPPSSPRCSVFWLLADLTKCRVVTDLASLIRHRFGFSSGAALGLYLDGGLLPPTESARLVRDNDCLRVKLEDVDIVENSVAVSNGLSYSYKKARKRRSTWEEEESDAENDQYIEKHWKEGEISETSSLEPDQDTKKKNKKRKRNEGGSENNGKWTPQKSGKEKRGKAEEKKQKRPPKSSKTKTLPERTKKRCVVQKSASIKNSSAETKRKKDIGLSAKANPETSSDSDSSATSSDDSHSKTSLGGKKSVEKESFIKSKSTGSHPKADRLVTSSAKAKGTQASSSSLDSSSSSDDQGSMPKRAPAPAPPPMGAAGSPRSSQTNGPDTDSHLGTRQEMRYSDLWDKPVLGNSGKQPAPLTAEAAPHPSSFGRGRGRGEDIFPWRGPRGRGFRGIRGRGRGGNINYVFNGESQKQQQLNEVVKNTSIIIQLLELTADYSPDVSSYKEGKIINYNPDAQEVDIEILSSLPVVKEPGKFDLVYQNENGTEVVEYAVSQDKRITICWKELIEPRLIIEPHTDTPNTEQA